MLDADHPDTHETDAATTSPGAVPEAGPPVEAKKAAKRAPAKKASAKKAPAKKAATKKAAQSKDQPDGVPEATSSTDPPIADESQTPAAKPVKRAARRTSKKAASAEPSSGSDHSADAGQAPVAAPSVLFQTPDAEAAKPTRRRSAKKAADKPEAEGEPGAATEPVATSAQAEADGDSGPDSEVDSDSESADDDASTRRRPRRRGGRRRRKPADGEDAEDSAESQAEDEDDSEEGGSGNTRRRRRRRRTGEEAGSGSDDPEKTTTRVRKTRNPEDEITALSGSTRLEAKKQRRREGREAGRRRAPIVSEAEFLARREAVDRVMVIRQREDLTQIGVLEDKVLVEHYVARESQTSLIGNVYLGRVQNVLPSMEAAFIDIGKGRNAVLYAGEVNWSALGAKDGQPRKIESVLKSGQPILVQVSKDPIGHKGARLTSQVSLPGRFLVYVPDGTTSGISRKLPENERNRLKTLLKEIVPDTAGVIVRTAAEGATEAELTQDVERLTARWADIEAKIKGGQSPQLLYGEPDLTLKVIRDLFTEDFTKLLVQGDDAWDLVENYVAHVAPDLSERLERYRPEDHDGVDLFGAHRLDEQIAKGLDRKVWLPSGGSLVIDRTEAMTVVDVNTGKFTGSGGNLEETVTKNNLEAAEEIVRQLRLRDIGGIIVVDFIDMVLESNRDLVLRRLVECLGRDRTRHQVAEVTSLGLVQMTRKRIGTGLLEAFTEDCEHCKGRGVTVHDHPIEPSASREDDDARRGGRRGRGGRARTAPNGNGTPPSPSGPPSPKDIAAIARPENADKPPLDERHLDPEDTDDTLAAGASVVDETLLEAPTDSPSDFSADVVGTTDEAEESTAGAEPDAALSQTPDELTPDVVPVEQAPEPAAPRLVTTSRRRSARRAAGPPAGTATEPATPSGEDASADPEGGEAAESAQEQETSDDGGFVLHVPIKRKGARKR